MDAATYVKMKNILAKKPTLALSKYMIDDIEAVNKKVALEKESFNFVCITDVHGYAEHLSGAAKATEYGTTEYLFNLGDTLLTENSDIDVVRNKFADYAYRLAEAKVPVHNSRGNHDSTTNGVFDQAEWANFMQKLHKNEVIHKDPLAPAGGYYYFDNENYKVRIIITNSTTNSIASRWGFDAQQLKWIAEAALDLTGKADDIDWNVIVFGHHPIKDSYDPLAFPADADVLAGTLKAFNEKTTYVDAGTGVNVDYSTHKARLVGYICGHVHLDICEIPADLGFLNVVICCSKFVNYTTEDLEGAGYYGTYPQNRVANSDTSYAWDVQCFNLRSRLLKAYRCGAGEDRSIYYDNFVKDDLVLWLDGGDFRNNPPTTSLIDRSGTGNNAAVSGLSVGTNGSNGKKGILCDGSSFYLESSYNASLDITGAITIHAKFKLSTIVGGQSILSKATLGAYSLMYNLDGDGLVKMYAHIGGSYSVVASDSVLVADTDYIVTARYDGAKMEMWINGAKQTNVTATTGNIATNRAGVFIGKATVPTPAYHLNGTFYHALLYSAALTDDEVAQNQLASVVCS